MDAQGIKQILREHFGENRPEIINGWVSIRCPLAPWQIEHKHGRDSRPSAGISVQPNGCSIFNCFTCGNKMPFHGFLRKYATCSGEDLESLIDEVEEHAYLGPRQLPSWDDREQVDADPEELQASLYLDLYDSAAGHPYLLQRGISNETARKLQLMLDPSDPADGEERILFPVFGPDGQLYGLTGRATNKEAKLKVRDYYGLRKAACLLGSHLIVKEKAKKVITVEGLFDYANAWECGQPAVAVMHSTMTPRQAAILRDLGLPTYLFYDNDEAGAKGVEAAGKALFKYLPVMKVKYPKVWIVDPEQKDGGHWLKDPGELLPEEFESMIRGCRLWY